MLEAARLSALAGQPAPPSVLIDVPKLITAYFADRQDAELPAQRVAFGTSGHRGSALDPTFNERHVLAITQAVCNYRRAQGINGSLFLGIDTHALSAPTRASATEVLAASDILLRLATNDVFTPTPAVSRAVISHNRGRDFECNPPHGGPAAQDVTDRIEAAANRYLEAGLADVKRVARAAALRAPHHLPPRRPQRLCRRSRQRDRHGRHPPCHAAVGRRPAGPGRGPLLGLDRRARPPRLERGQRRCRSDLPLHQSGLGWADSHGPVLAVRHAAADIGQDRFDIPFACPRPRGVACNIGCRHSGGQHAVDRPGGSGHAATEAAFGFAVGTTDHVDRTGREKIQPIRTRTPGNGAAIGGIKVSTDGGWFAARPSGTENIHKIYAESFRSTEHLQCILQEAQTMVAAVIGLP